MPRLAISAACCLTILLGSCSKPEESVTEVKNGVFKVLVRSQEFHHSAIQNIDICVAESSSRGFPNNKEQCFFHGFDFSGLSVKWRTECEIEVSFADGRVSYFRNYAIVSPNRSNPVGFHATLRDGCSTESQEVGTTRGRARGCDD
jgi:hypothetical protein